MTGIHFSILVNVDWNILWLVTMLLTVSAWARILAERYDIPKKMDNRSGHMSGGKTQGGKFLMFLVNLFLCSTGTSESLWGRVPFPRDSRGEK